MDQKGYSEGKNENSDQIPTVDDIVALFKMIDFETAKQVTAALNRDNVFAGCATWSCRTKNHGEVG